MRIVLAIVFLVVVLLLVFVAANWQTLTAATPLSFVVVTVDGPLGVILLGVMVVLTALVFAYALLLRTKWLMESRRVNRQLEEQRRLAETAESSRFTALQELLMREFGIVNESLSKIGDAGSSRIAECENAIVKALEDSGNSIMAHLGYIDNKLKDDQ